MPKTKILVTGGSGFLGTHLIEELVSAGYENVDNLSPLVDLTDKESVLRGDSLNYDVVFHLAAKIAGIKENSSQPADFLVDNMLMTTNLMTLCLLGGIKKVVYIGTVCSYPEEASIPWKEEDLWQGLPEKSNRGYGVAKRNALAILEAHKQQYGIDFIYPILTNLYGPRDKSSHVIPDLFRKFSTQDKVELWGDGFVTREFLYVKDAARAIRRLSEEYDSSEPINVPSGQEVTIRAVADMIQRLTGFKGEVSWDTSKPSGSKRRLVNGGKFMSLFPDFKFTHIKEGLEKTYDDQK